MWFQVQFLAPHMPDMLWFSHINKPLKVFHLDVNVLERVIVKFASTFHHLKCSSFRERGVLCIKRGCLQSIGKARKNPHGNGKSYTVCGELTGPVIGPAIVSHLWKVEILTAKVKKKTPANRDTGFFKGSLYPSTTCPLRPRREIGWVSRGKLILPISHTMPTKPQQASHRNFLIIVHIEGTQWNSKMAYRFTL